MDASSNPELKDLVRFTRWVNGKKSARCWAHRGRFSIGKKVPLKRNMGVINKNIGKLNSSICVVIPVINIPTDPKAIPPRSASGIIKSPWGYRIRPNKLMTAIMIAVAMTDLVAPQMISPVMISSTDKGVAIMASKVF